MDFRTDPKFKEITAALEQSRGLPSGLLEALVGVESHGNPNAKSPVGAQGLTQFMPATAAQYKVDVNDPVDSLRGTADYLQDLIHKFDGNVRAALAFYNGGAHNAQYQVDGTAPGRDKVSPANHETNKRYVNDITSKVKLDGAPEQGASDGVQQVRSFVVGLAKQNASPDIIINQLMRNPATAALVAEGMKSGDSPEQIVATLGGAEYKPFAEARSRIGSQNVLQNAWDGGKNAVSDMALGARQIIANPEEEQALRAEAARRKQDPERVALNDTAGAAIGEFGVKSAPYLAAALMTGGSSIPAMALGQAGAGAIEGALTPTTEDGERASNMATNAAVAGGTAGAFGIGGKVIGKAFSPSAKVVAEREKLAAALRQEGLPVNAVTLTDGGKNLASRMATNGSVQTFRDATDQVIAGKVAKGLGLDDWAGAIDSDLLNTARPAIQRTLDDATDVLITLPQSLKDDLGSVLGRGTNPLVEGIATNNVVKQAATNLTKAIDEGATVAGKHLQDLASELKAVAANTSASASERRVAGDLVGKLNKTLTDAMTPEQAARFMAANRQWANLKAVENMVRTSGDTGMVTPRQMVNSVKSGRFKNSFLKGEAPYQELAGTLGEALGPANGRGLGDVLGKALGTGDGVLGAATILEPTTGLTALAGKKLAEKLLGKAITSENLTIVKLMTGVGRKMSKAQQHYIARALGVAAGAGTN